MAYVLNDPADFAEELTSGFVLAYSEWVTQVPGGVVRASQAPAGEVAIIIGGGSGHYPAFAGLVGPGLAHGAAMGNIFASPSATQIYDVAKTAHNGGGVLFTYGNYAGDVLNFDQAQQRLRDEGIECSTVVVTDDIASAPETERFKRRGIAGDLFVFKAASAAAEAGKSLEEVTRIATLANDRVRTLGVAFTGCTLPGATEPLFTIPAGRMGVGVGIHGEPGIGEEDIPTAHDLAQLLTHRVLEEKPDDASNRIVVLLNGLGGVKYEELFVLYKSVSQLLNAAGLTIVQPDVGELVTSFEMAGVSLTIAWLTEELEDYWAAPANTPAYRKGSRDLGERRSFETRNLDQHTVAHASAESRQSGQVIAHVLSLIADTIDTNVDYLGELDATAGDGDHGIGMQRGSRAAASEAQNQAARNHGAATILAAAGQSWADKAGGTSGALWGTLLRAVASSLSDSQEITDVAVVEGVQRGAQQVQDFGKAQVGDKTMVDAIVPFAETLAHEVRKGHSLTLSFATASQRCFEAAEATAELLPKVGRARPHAEKSLGTPDPGAMSFALITRTIAEHLNE